MSPAPVKAASPHADARGAAALLERLSAAFVGADTEYPLADGRRTRRHYLDSAASTLMLRPAMGVARRFLDHYANTHSRLHHGARVATETYQWAHEQVLAFTGADPRRYACFFRGSGSTEGFNRVARALAALRPERDVVLVSEMEHHSNDLPHRRHAGRVVHVPAAGTAPALGAMDLDALERLLERYRGRVNYVAVTGASNVTGILNPLGEIAERVHGHGAWLIADASQLLAHAPVRVCDPGHPARDLDFLVFSGHKIYAPGSPGVVVGRRDLLDAVEPETYGGGMVEDVYLHEYSLAAGLPEREEAGTPNIVGAVLLAAVLAILDRVGMDAVHAREQRLLRQALERLGRLPGVRLYGDTDLEAVPRTGTVSFNLQGLDHGLVAAALNDYHNVAVRNECFCAQPYVREMLKSELWDLDLDPDDPAARELIKLKQGMVRASFGLYNTEADVDALCEGVADLLARPGFFRASYRPGKGGDYHHRSFRVPSGALFDPVAEVEAALGGSPGSR